MELFFKQLYFLKIHLYWRSKLAASYIVDFIREDILFYLFKKGILNPEINESDNNYHNVISKTIVYQLFITRCYI